MDDIEKVIKEISERHAFDRVAVSPGIYPDDSEMIQHAAREILESPVIRAHILQSAWRPIGEAPKTGVEVLVCRPDTAPFVCRYVAPCELDENNTGEDPDWYSDAYGFQAGSDEPTHFQHLPPLPPTGGEHE